MATTRSSAFFQVFDPLFLQHRSRGYHPERPERLSAAKRGVEHVESEGARVIALPPRDVTAAELHRVHDAGYLAELFRLAGHHAALDGDTYLAPASIDAARRAAGGAIALTEAILAAGEGEPRQGIALLRPPGHHATRDQGMGFCLLNNVAIAAAAAIAGGIGRVAIVDWDVHHGNGTQDIFYADGRVLFVSLHEAPLYPGTGSTQEIGEGSGRGRIVNVPLPAGANDAVYRLAFDEVVLPALRDFGPEIILVSAGYDGHTRDPLASMELTDAGFAWMGRALREVADETAGGRLGLVLEGGYDLTALEEAVASSLRGALGGPISEPSGDVGERHRDAIDSAKRAASAARAS